MCRTAIPIMNEFKFKGLILPFVLSANTTPVKKEDNNKIRNKNMLNDVTRYVWITRDKQSKTTICSQGGFYVVLTFIFGRFQYLHCILIVLV